jgi:hypothetical protein
MICFAVIEGSLATSRNACSQKTQPRDEMPVKEEPARQRPQGPVGLVSNVRFGSLADIGARIWDVRFPPSKQAASRSMARHARITPRVRELCDAK